MSTTSRLISYGSSVLYGSELPKGSLSMSAIIAQKLGLDYLCRAKPMSSNTKIARKIISYQEYQNDFVLVMWTAPNRYEFKSEHGWRGFTTYNHRDALLTEWFNGPGGLEYTEVMTTLQAMCLAQQFLVSRGIPYLFVTDYSIVKESGTFNSNDEYITSMKNLINWDKFLYFDNEGFVPWAKKNNFEFVGTHPSTESHQEAAAIILASAMLSMVTNSI